VTTFGIQGGLDRDQQLIVVAKACGIGLDDQAVPLNSASSPASRSSSTASSTPSNRAT